MGNSDFLKVIKNFIDSRSENKVNSYNTADNAKLSLNGWRSNGINQLKGPGNIDTSGNSSNNSGFAQGNLGYPGD